VGLPSRPTESIARVDHCDAWLKHTQQTTITTSDGAAQKGSAMTGLAVQRCPTCEFRFSSRTGLDYHMSVDHPVPPPMARADRPSVSNAVASAHVARDRRGVAERRQHAIGVVLAFAALLLVAYAAVSLSMSATVVISLGVIGVLAIYLRRSRSWPRLPRR
jgi:hypothetical protein